MSYNIIRKELRLNRRSFLIWAGVVLLIIAIYLPFFPYMQDPEFAKLLEGYPDTIKDAFNITGSLFQDINLYYAGMVMQYALLLALIYTAMLAGRLISREADLNTAEFLFTRPLTRSRIMASKTALFLLLNLLLWALLYGASLAVGSATAPGDFDPSGQLLVHLAGFLASLAVGGIAFAAAPFINTVQGTTSLGVGLGFGFFIIDALSKLTEKLAFLKYINLYHYAALEDAVAGEPFLAGMAVLLLLFLLGTGLGFRFLNRKEFTG
ncbi:MAG: ABC transporter permease subunit [Bacillota bacterium]